MVSMEMRILFLALLLLGLAQLTFSFRPLFSKQRLQAKFTVPSMIVTRLSAEQGKSESEKTIEAVVPNNNNTASKRESFFNSLKTMTLNIQKIYYGNL